MNDNNLTTFYILRHGETDWNAKRLLQGQTDIDLNENGIRQAKDLAKEFSLIKFDKIFSSDLIRAKKTAEIIALEHKLAVEATQLLRERSFGKFEGQHVSEADSMFNELKKLTHEERFKQTIFPEVDNDEKLSSDFFMLVRELAIVYKGKTILMVSHGGMLRSILLKLGYVTYDSDAYISNLGYIKLESNGIDFFVKDVIGLEKRSIK